MILQHYRSQNTSGSSTPGYGFALPQQNSSNSQLPRLDFSSIHVPGRGGASGSAGASTSSGPKVDNSSPAFIRDTLLNDPEQLAIVKQNNPALADALVSGDFGMCILCMSDLLML